MRETSPRSTIGASVRKWAVLLLKLILVLFCLLILLAAVGSDPFLAELPFHFVGGWVIYLLHVRSQISMNYDLLWSSLLALCVAVAGLHGIARWLWRQSKPGAGSWQFRWTAAFTAMLLLLFASANAGAGIGHQIGWLKSMPWIRDGSRADSMWQANNGRQIVICIKAWAGDHKGAYPRTLADLVNDTDDGLTLPQFQGLALVRWPRDATPEPWLYVGAELNDSAPGQLPLLASPRTRKGKRIVCHNDGSTEAEPEDQYQKELAELRQYLGQAKR